MKYIVAVKYVKREEKLDTRIFEFNNKKERTSFVDGIRHIASDYAFSQIEEKEWEHFISVGK